MKRIGKIIVALLILLLVLVALILFFLGPILKKAVETAGPTVTGVPVELQSASLSPLTGKGRLENFTVHNPPGYKSSEAIHVDELALNVDPKSLLSDKVHIRSLRLIGPRITLEGTPTKNNLKTILDHLNQVTGSGSSSSPSGSQKSSQGGKKLQVDDLQILAPKLEVRSPLLGEQPVIVELPNITLKNLGQGPEGITSAELAKRVLQQILQLVNKVGGNSLQDLAKKAAQKQLKQTASKTVEALKEKAQKGLQKELQKNLQKGLGGLLPSSKEKNQP